MIIVRNLNGVPEPNEVRWCRKRMLNRRWSLLAHLRGCVSHWRTKELKWGTFPSWFFGWFFLGLYLAIAPISNPEDSIRRTRTHSRWWRSGNYCDGRFLRRQEFRVKASLTLPSDCCSGHGDPTKIELFHPELVVQDSQARRLSNAKMPAQRFARSERLFFQHRCDCFGQIIWKLPPRGRVIAQRSSPSTKLLHHFLTVARASASFLYRHRSSATMVPAWRPLSVRKRITARCCINIQEGQTTVHLFQNVKCADVVGGARTYHRSMGEEKMMYRVLWFILRCIQYSLR
jgi:hypothetical protein